MSTRRDSYQRGTIARVPRAKGPDVWVFRYYRYDLQGNRERVAEQFSDVAECPTKAAAEKKAEPIRKRINEERACVTFGDLADKFETDSLPTRRPHTQKTHLSNLKHLRARWKDVRLEEMVEKPMEIQLWVNALKDSNGHDYARETRKHVRNLLHKIFEDAMLWGLLPVQRNPIDLVHVAQGKRTKRRTLILTPRQIDDLLKEETLATTAPHVRIMVIVAIWTGMRISEVLGLRWEDIDFDAATIWIRRSADGAHVGDTKSEESEHESYPMHESLAAELKAWRDNEEFPPIKGWVFGNALTERPFHASTLLADHLKPAAEKVGIVGLGWHSFRHTYRALLADLEEQLEVQQALMRHSSPEMTLHYGKFSAKRQEKLRRANARVVEMSQGRR